MDDLSQVALMGVFDQIKEPILIFAKEEIIYLNRYFKEKFKIDFNNFYEFLLNDGIETEINDFFRKGELPQMEIIRPLVDLSGFTRNYKWQFAKLVDESTNEDLLFLKGILLSDNSEVKSKGVDGNDPFEWELLINKISKKIVNASFEQLDDVFNESLTLLGEFEKVDRAYIFLFQESSFEIDKGYEWVRMDIEPQIDFVRQLQISDEFMSVQVLRNGQVFLIPDVSKMEDKYAVERSIFQKQSIDSVILIPIMSELKLIGFFGLDSVGRIRNWGDGDIYILTQLADVFSGALKSKQIKRDLKMQSQILAQIKDSIVVTDTALNVLYMNDAGYKESGVDLKSTLGCKIFDLFDFNTHQKFEIQEELDELVNVEEIKREIVVVNSLGNSIPIELYMKVFHNDQNEVVGYTFVMRNLSQINHQKDLAKKAKMIIENSSSVLFTLDPNDHFRILYITENIHQFGYSAKKLLASKASILDIIHPDDAEELIHYHYAKKDKRGVPAYSGEYRIRKKDGTYRWVEDKTREVFDHFGQIVLHEGVIQDVTDRKRDREEILRAKQQYRVLAANIPLTSVFLIDRNLTYVVAEGTNFRKWNMTSGDFENKSVEEVHVHNLDEIKIAVESSLKDRTFTQKNIKFRDRVYEMTVRPIIHDGEVEYALGIIRDINVEYEAKERLRASEEKYRTLVEESTEIIFSVGIDMTLIYVSPNVKQFLGFEAHEVIGDNLINFLHEDDRKIFVGLLETHATDFFEANQYIEYKLKHKDGTFRIMSSNGRLIKDEHGNIKQYTGIARDITKLKNTQYDLYLAKEKAEQALTIKSQFLSIMSHEIRTPMNAVIGMAHLLIEDQPRPDQLENLKTLQFSAENLLGLINDILDYTKIDSGKVELEKVAFDLRLLFNRIIHSYSYQVREKNLDVRFEVDCNLPKIVMSDPVRLSQVANNLISNAIKFTESGFVKIKLTNIYESETKVRIKFEFEDSGIGIPEEKLHSIFEAFTQASAATTRKYGGTGLGLAIVKRLVGLFGGDILVERQENGGTLFRFELDLEKPSAMQVKMNQEVSAIDNIDLSHVEVLVAEDNLVNQIMIKKFLTKWGVTNIVIANDGVEAVEALERQKFDLILLDLQMPEMDGFEVGQFIRNHPKEEVRNLPIIALTASSLLEVKDQLEGIGMNDFISKPFNPDNLYTKIIKYLKL
ncbi:PAS domain S-box protein [Belliella kenyensis]|uniref:histidine kinase n=1 Tax=Belliella kenyensis TaxID=1472724 RepID=A0ABV8EQB9_9BACT|nr:PAS domain S-box protein [Belliella kenyensis]MCH7402146.1 PAS domain S-box protein [Belliella kenyensis]MDN3601661.1 PAS domain S-box protein [Belliella kenyensis]